MKRWKYKNYCHQICLIMYFCCLIQWARSLTVDNELVSARNDCFERIALEAMIPFEKTFKTEDINSLRMCKENCIQEGDKCQSISFGVHRRGNGTCQLSKVKYKIGSRPKGVIFDPDFDLYVRKANCFELSDNILHDQSDNLKNTNAYGGNVAPATTVLLPTQPSQDTTVLLMEPNPSVVTTLQDETTHYIKPTAGYGGSDATTIFTQGPGATYEPSTQNVPSTPANNGDRLHFSLATYPLYKYPTLYEPNYPAPNQDVYMPGGYAANAQEVDDRYSPSSGDSTLDPTSATNYNGPAKPMFGLGYGSGYGYSESESNNPPTVSPQDAGYSSNAPTPNNMNKDSPKPTSGYENSNNRDPYRMDNYDNNYGDKDRLRPASYDGTTVRSPHYEGPNNGQSSLPPYGSSANSQTQFSSRPYNEQNPAAPYDTYADNGYTSPAIYNPRPDHSDSSSTTYGAHRPMTHRPVDFMDFTNRPDAPDGTSRPSFYGPNFNNFEMRRNGTAASTPGGSYNDDKHINTYFNPEDYLMGNKRRPGAYGDSNRPDYMQGSMKACFRRVLAGKRIAPHWVRRTIACERVEECMRECGREKRFTCEGFNYRLDPSGHGQGDCELIEIPLPQIDLYSSPNRRDSNLLRHPDYDYYERDRNAPNSCRYNMCKECSSKLPSPPALPHYNKPSQSWSEKPYKNERFPHIPSPPSSSGSGYYDRPPPSSSSLEHYPSGPSPHSSYESHARPPPSFEQHSGSYEFSSHASSYYEHSPPSSYGSSGSHVDPVDRYDVSHGDRYRPSYTSRWESIPSSTGYDASKHDRYGPPYRPGPEYSPYRPTDSHAVTGPDSYHPRPRPISHTHNYLDRGPGPVSSSKKNSGKFVPYLIGTDNEWGSYGGSYGGTHNKQTAYWGLVDNHYKPRDPVNFDYSNLGSTPAKSSGFRGEPPHESNAIVPYSGSNYGSYGKYDDFRDRHDYRHQWTRRPGPDECSAKTSEGFRLHKNIVKHKYSTPSLTECERLCSGQDAFICHTYSYRYASGSHDNCMLCDRPINRLDYYVDIEPDRDYDIYSMSDDVNVCRKHTHNEGPSRGGISTTALSDPRSTQCFFRAIDATRFYKSIVRDSLTVRSVGECEMECIKSTKFSCRAFAFRYGQRRHASVIDNCQLSDWPVRDMDKERHLILDNSFDIFERASYGHGCEIQPIADEKHKKLCYLGYGSPAKLLPLAIKKVITVPSELECKKECVHLRETTAFKCYSFSYGSRKSTFNCEMSDCDQTELKLNVHYTHTDDRDNWLFAWNPFDYTCRDKVNTIGGSRVNNNRRMDIFREPDEPWRHYSVSGKPCRRSSPCEKNLITGFYSCEIESSEIGAWDYCCKVDHPCGYSQGFDYPWCFVGDEPDQWRKCSDRYYPGNHTQKHSGLSVKPLNSSDKRKPNDNFLSASNSDEYQKPPRPGGLQSLSDFTAARLWPVTYLYSEGPPNSTEFSNFVDCNKETC